MKLCILHTGHPKTGTSSLQRYLLANHDALLARGILYPRPSRKRVTLEPLPWAGHQHGPALKKVARRKAEVKPGTQLDQLIRSIEGVPHDVLLLSAEFLFAALFYRKKARIWNFLKRYGYEIETVTYIRDQPDRLNSAYVQQTKTGNTWLPFDEFCAKRIGAADSDDEAVQPMFYDRLLDPDHAAWGRHNFRPFAAAVKANGIERDFMEELAGILARHGLGDRLTPEIVAGFVRPPRVNEADGTIMVAAGRKIAHKIAERLGEDSPKVKMLHGNVYRRLTEIMEELGVKDRKYSAMTPERYARLRAIFADSNERFAQAVWGRPWAEMFPPTPEEALFTNDLDETRDPAQRAVYHEIVAKARPAFRADLAHVLRHL
jgi:hypothetical protein